MKFLKSCGYQDVNYDILKKKKKEKKENLNFLKKLSNNFLKKLLNSLETAQANVLAWLFLRI